MMYYYDEPFDYPWLDELTDDDEYDLVTIEDEDYDYGPIRYDCE